MKLSFSTRGWGDLSWEQLLDSALEMKFSGIEVYNLFKFPAMTGRGGPFHKHSVAATVRALRDKKLTVPCFDTSMDISLSPENAEEKYSYVQCLASTAKLIMIQYAMTKTEMSESSGCGKLSCLWRGAILAIVL